MLRFANTYKPCLGDVHDGMDIMVEKVKLFIQTHENDPIQCEALCNKLETIIHHSWEKMTTPLHLLTYALSLRYYSKEVLAMPTGVAPYADEVSNGCYKAFARLFKDDEMYKKVRLEFGLFASGAKLRPITINDQNDFNMRVITWWYLYGQPLRIYNLLHSKSSHKCDDDDNIRTHGASSTSGTILDSNDIELAADGDDGDADFLENPYDSNSD